MALFRLNLKTLCRLNPLRELNAGINYLNQSLHTSATNYDGEWNVYHLCLPKPLYNKFRRKIYYPDKYTVEPLRNDHLAGRDPNTGTLNEILINCFSFYPYMSCYRSSCYGKTRRRSQTQIPLGRF